MLDKNQIKDAVDHERTRLHDALGIERSNYHTATGSAPLREGDERLPGSDITIVSECHCRISYEINVNGNKVPIQLTALNVIRVPDREVGSANGVNVVVAGTTSSWHDGENYLTFAKQVSEALASRRIR